MKEIQNLLDKVMENILKIQGEENLEVVQDTIQTLAEIDKTLYQLVYKTQSDLVEIFQNLDMEEIVELQQLNEGAED